MYNKAKFLYYLNLLVNKFQKFRIKNFVTYPLISISLPLSDKEQNNDNNITYKYWTIRTRHELIQEADKLFNKGSFLQVYELLNKIKYSHFADVQWRISRALFKLASDPSLSEEIKESMILEAYVLMKDTIDIGIEDPNIYKWMAIILDAQSSLQGTEEHVKSFPEIQKYLRKAFELNPNDVVVLYMLGRLCYEMSHLTRIQRFIARLLYSTPPKASYEEAYTFLTKACEIEKEKYYIPNYYILGKTCKHLKQYFKARYYFNRAYTMPARTKQEEQCSYKAKIMNESMDGYEISDDMTCTF